MMAVVNGALRAEATREVLPGIVESNVWSAQGDEMPLVWRPLAFLPGQWQYRPGLFRNADIDDGEGFHG